MAEQLGGNPAGADELRRRLEEAESRFHSFLATAADWCWETDPEGRMTWVSRDTARPADELLGRLRWEIAGADPESESAWRAHLDDLRAGRPFRDFRYVMEQPDGTLLHVSVSGDPVLGPDGRPVAWRGTGRDVSAEVEAARRVDESRARVAEAERAIRERVRFFSALLENTADGITVLDAAGVVKFKTPSVLRGTGLSLSDVLGREWLERAHPEDRPVLREKLLQARTTGELTTAVCRMAAQGGEWRSCELCISDRTGDPAIGGVIVNSRDVTDRLARERALAESERRFRELTEGSLQGVTINQGGRIVYANGALCRIFGYAPGELLARDRWLLVAPADLEPLKELLRGGGPERFAFRGRRKDGALLWLECVNRQIEWDGAPAWQVVVMDVTERRRAEEQLLRAQKMEAVGQLTGGVAHDFNNLLAVILGNLDLIREAGLLPPGQARMLDSVMAAAGRGAELVRSLLAFARRQQLNPEQADLNRLVERAAGLLRRTLGAAIRIDAPLASGLDPVLIDPTLLEAALLNLAFNARDAMPDGGCLTIETQNVELGPEELAGLPDASPGGYVMLAVTDTGSGMTPEVRERAFEPFFTTKEVGKGTGLGLSMLYGFVKQSGGHVRLYSEPGVGTTFKLYFPRANGGAPGPADEAAKLPALDGLRVLLVEDDADVRETALSMLRSLGCAAAVARDGAEALEALRGPAPFDLLLTDMVLPGGLRGPEIAAEAQALRPDLKVLFMSGYAPQGARAAVDQPQGALLSKPFRRVDLARALEHAVAA